MRIYTGVIQISTMPLQENKPYVSVLINKQTIDPYITYISKILSPEDFSMYTQAKMMRDGPEHHMTVVNPIEFNLMAEESNWRSFLGIPVTVNLIGIGKISEAGAESYFVLCECHEVQVIRKILGLRNAGLHITLGFKNRDIYDKIRSFNDLIEPFSLIYNHNTNSCNS